MKQRNAEALLIENQISSEDFAPNALRLTPSGALLLVATAWLTFKKWADYDIFWHLANGRLMSERGVFPSPDQFSWSAAGQHVALNSVRLDLLTYMFWKQGGAFALSMLSALLLIATLLPAALFLGRLRLKIWVEGCALFVLIFALLPYAGMRPHLVGAASLGAIALLAERPFGLRKSLTAGVVLSLWLNLHGSFIFGFLILGIAVLAWLHANDFRAAGFASLSIAIAGASTVFSPYGFELWLMPLRLSSNGLLQKYNQDWASLNPFALSCLPMALLIVAAAGLGVWRQSDPRALTVLIIILPTLQFARLTPFAAPILVMVVAERLAERVPSLLRPLPEQGTEAEAGRRATRVAWSTLAIGFAAMSLAGVRTLDAAAVRPLPSAAVDQLLQCGTPAPIWNDYNWGGYLIWRGDGRYAISMDGRAETLYDPKLFEHYVEVLTGQAGWERTIQQSPAQYALTPAGARTKIDALPGWHRVYADSVAVIAARDGTVWRCATPKANATNAPDATASNTANLKSVVA